MKIELPQEPNVERLWTKDRTTGQAIEWKRATTVDGWTQVKYGRAMTWPQLLAVFAPVYTTHPDFAALERYPTPWTRSASGTLRDATGKAVLDPTMQCPPCLTALIMRAVNELADRVGQGSTTAGECAADEEDKKR